MVFFLLGQLNVSEQRARQSFLRRWRRVQTDQYHRWGQRWQFTDSV